MSRQWFENDKDLINETNAMNIACRHWQCKAFKLNVTKFNIDFVAYKVSHGYGVVSENDRKNRVQSNDGGFYVEVRCRKNNKNRYPTMMLSEKKWLELKKYSWPDAPAIFLVKWDDCIGYVEYSENLKITRQWGGRNQMRDKEDVEPMIHIPTSAFKIISTTKSG